MKKTLRSTFNRLVMDELITVDQRIFRAISPLRDKVCDGTLSDDDQGCIDKLKELLSVIADKVLIKMSVVGSQEGNELKQEFINSFALDLESIERERNSVDILCPCCKTKLVFVKRDNYETLDDHVSNPNGQVSNKDAYGCPNHDCEACKCKLEWLGSGEGPYTHSFNKPKFIDNNNAPFKTIWRQINAEKQRTIGSIGPRKFYMQVRQSARADQNGKVKFWTLRWDCRLVINNTVYMPGIRMLAFSLKQYSRKDIRQQQFKDYHKWQYKRKDWWRKLSFWIARVLWRADYLKSVSIVQR